MGDHNVCPSCGGDSLGKALPECQTPSRSHPAMHRRMRPRARNVLVVWVLLVGVVIGLAAFDVVPWGGIVGLVAAMPVYIVLMWGTFFEDVPDETLRGAA